MLTLTAATVWLVGITLVVAACSELLTGSIEAVSEKWGLSQSFLGFIVLPIAGELVSCCCFLLVVVVFGSVSLRGLHLWAVGGRWRGARSHQHTNTRSTTTPQKKQPTKGNACEHITAVFVAYKNKMDLALGVAIGSTLQIGLFAIPFITLFGWATGHPFSLGFDPFAALVLLLSVLHANFMLNDAESHWLEGVQLLVTYFTIAVAYALG